MEPVTKKQLSRYIGLKIQNENYAERIARMRSSVQFPPMQYEQNESQHQPGGVDRLGAAVTHALEVEDELEARIAANCEEMRKLRSAIATLEPMEANVLWLRYIDDLDGQRRTWEDIADKMYHNVDKVRTVTRLHGQALEHIRKVSV